MKPGVVLASVLILVATTGAARASDGLSLRGYGTAVVDGVLSPNEWDRAAHYDFQANRSPAEGGGTVPATLFVMNEPWITPIPWKNQMPPTMATRTPTT